MAIREAYDAGLCHFGENRVQEWEGKRSELADISSACTWHLIGHLQSNKAVRAAKYFNRIDSVDDFSLAQKLNRALADFGPSAKLRVLIEVHIGEEESKTGVAENDLTQTCRRNADARTPQPVWPDVHSTVWRKSGISASTLCASTKLEGKTRGPSPDRAADPFDGHVA